MNEHDAALNLGTFINSFSLISGGINLCPVQCSFCFMNHNNPINLIDDNCHKTPFLTMEYLPPYVKVIESYKGVLKKVMIEGWWIDPFANPHLYEIIYYLTSRFPNVQFTVLTTGTHIEEGEIARLSGIKNLLLTLSIHTFDEKLRSNIFAKHNTEKVIKIYRDVNSFPILSSIDNVPYLARDLDILRSKKSVNSLLFRQIEYTKFSNKKATDCAITSTANFERNLSYLTSMATDFTKTYWCPDVIFCRKYNVFVPELEEQLVHIDKCIGELPQGNYLFCAPQSSFSFFKEEYANRKNIEVVEVINTVLGGSVTVAGLTLFCDVIKAIRQYDLSAYSGFIISNDMLVPHRRCDLLAITPESAAAEVGIPCYPMGLTRNFLKY